MFIMHVLAGSLHSFWGKFCDRKIDSAVHRIVILSIAAEMHNDSTYQEIKSGGGVRKYHRCTGPLSTGGAVIIFPEKNFSLPGKKIS